MVTRADLLQAVLDDPADDGVRLVFSDYLEEHGEEALGEFVRVQVELEVLTPGGICPTCDNYGGPCDHCEFGRIDALRRRERALLEWPTGAAIAASVARAFGRTRFGVDHGWNGGQGGLRWTWRRGFVDEVACDCASWLEHAGAVMAAHPVTRVRLDRVPSLINGAWRWASEDCLRHATELNPQCRIPVCVWRLLPGDNRGRRFWSVTYDTRELADAALNAAALLYGQQQRSKLARDLRRARP